MRFHKMQGCGNDFIVVEPAGSREEFDRERVRALCDRRYGIGADGVLVVGALDGGRWPIAIHNADGSLAESCGNGARCVARYLLDRRGGEMVELATPGGLVTARREGDGIAVTLAAPRVGGAFSFALDSAAHDGVTVDAGNPHLVVFVDDPRRVDLPHLAAAARAAAGDGNVEAVAVLGPGHIALRVDERGVGETLACGSGSVAAVAAAFGRGVASDTVEVTLPGGTLLVRRGAGVYELSGPAEYVFEGVI